MSDDQDLALKTCVLKNNHTSDKRRNIINCNHMIR